MLRPIHWLLCYNFAKCYHCGKHVCGFSGTVVTKHHQLGDLTQQKSVLSLSWRLEVPGDQGGGRTMLPPKLLGEKTCLFQLLVAPVIPQSMSASLRAMPPSSHHCLPSLRLHFYVCSPLLRWTPFMLDDSSPP